jgi:hypothetical protein
MEAAWAHRPVAVSPVIRELVQGLNDSMNDADRQALKTLIPMLPGSLGDDALEAVRSWRVLDWHCRTWTSAWLRCAGCREEAAALESAAPITGVHALTAARHPLSRARASAAARLAAEIAAGNVLLGASGYAFAVAEVAAPRVAVRALASSSAWRSGWDLSRAGAETDWDLALGDARRTGRDAAVAVAWRAARAAAAKADQRAAWMAAVDAATADLRTEVVALQRAVIELVASLVDLKVDSLVDLKIEAPVDREVGPSAGRDSHVVG